MDLILWRHAEAEELRAGMADNERRLTGKGHKQAKKMAAWLAPRLPADARILVSPALRTMETAQALDREFEICNRIFTDSSLHDHLTAARWPEAGTVVVVGHQPTLGQLAALLMSGHAHPWEIKKGALWWLRSVANGGATQATLRTAILPTLLD